MLFAVPQEMPSSKSDVDEELIRAVYPQLRNAARWMLQSERAGHTLQPTALVHETFLKLFGKVPDAAQNPKAFLALAAHQMRQILIDYGRRRNSQKRGGDLARVPLFDLPQQGVNSFTDLNDALERLGELDARLVTVVELKYFAGFTNDEMAEILGVSHATVEARWHHARLWLLRELSAPVPRKTSPRA